MVSTVLTHSHEAHKYRGGHASFDKSAVMGVMNVNSEHHGGHNTVCAWFGLN